MEKLHKLAEPERFSSIRLQKSPALEFLLFDGQFQDREIMSYVIQNINNSKLFEDYMPRGSNICLDILFYDFFKVKLFIVFKNYKEIGQL